MLGLFNLQMPTSTLHRDLTLGAGGGTILTLTGSPPTNPTLNGVISGAGPFTVDGGLI